MLMQRLRANFVNKQVVGDVDILKAHTHHQQIFFFALEKGKVRTKIYIL